MFDNNISKGKNMSNISFLGAIITQPASVDKFTRPFYAKTNSDSGCQSMALNYDFYAGSVAAKDKKVLVVYGKDYDVLSDFFKKHLDSVPISEVENKMPLSTRTAIRKKNLANALLPLIKVPEALTDEAIKKFTSRMSNLTTEKLTPELLTKALTSMLSSAKK